MADIKIRNLPDWIMNWHRRQAEKEGVSLEEHIRRALQEDVMEDRRKLVAKLDAHCAQIEARTGILADSTPLIREAREEMEGKFDARPGRQRGGEVVRPRRKTA